MSVANLPHLVQQLGELGFEQQGTEFCRDGLRAHFAPCWLTLRTQADHEGGPNSGASGAPGLWKHVRSPGGHPERVFDLPLATVAERETWDDATGDSLHPLNAMLDWVDATRCGRLPSGWRSPAREELEESLPRQALTLEIGPFARQGQLCCDDSRLSVSLPLLQRVPVDLSPEHRACLDQLLADVQNRSRLVRLIEPATRAEARSILAEVDLSGVPRFAMPCLLRIGLDAVRHVVSQSISASELLVNPAVTSTVWRIPSGQKHSAERSKK